MSEGLTIVPKPVPSVPPAHTVRHGITPPIPRVAGVDDDPNDRMIWRIMGGHHFLGYTKAEAEAEYNG